MCVCVYVCVCAMCVCVCVCVCVQCVYVQWRACNVMQCMWCMKDEIRGMYEQRVGEEEREETER